MKRLIIGWNGNLLENILEVKFFVNNGSVGYGIHYYNISILINGVPGAKFKPSRGIKQREPSSPYTFNTSVEYWGRYLHLMVNTPKSYIGIKIAKQPPKVPYLMFAEDCLVFSKASNGATGTINDILDNYENYPGN